MIMATKDESTLGEEGEEGWIIWALKKKIY
jgi:hypothetical protein